MVTKWQDMEADGSTYISLECLASVHQGTQLNHKHKHTQLANKQQKQEAKFNTWHLIKQLMDYSRQMLPQKVTKCYKIGRNRCYKDPLRKHGFSKTYNS